MKNGNPRKGKTKNEICPYSLEERKVASVTLRRTSLFYKKMICVLTTLLALLECHPSYADSTDLGLIDLAPGETIAFTKVVSRHWYYASSRSSSYDCIYAQIKVPVGTPIICRIEPNLSPETINSIGNAWSYTNTYNRVKFALYTEPTYTSTFKLYENTYSLEQAKRIYVPATADYPYNRTYYAVIHHYRFSTDVASQNTYYDISFTWPVAPAQPPNITVQKSGAGIQVSWGVSQLATSYRLYKYCNGSFVTKWDRTDNSFYDSDVSNGNSYQYYVDARNEYGTSEMLGSSILTYGQDSTTAPSNDNFSSPIIISGMSGSKAGSNIGATLESSEKKPSAQSSSTGSVWYKWTAPSSGTVTFDTIGSGFDTILGVYTGTSVSGLTEIDSSDDIESGNTKSRVTFTANSGTTYRIAVYGYNGATGSFSLNWSLASNGGSGSGGAKYALCVGLNNYDMTSWLNQGWKLTVLKGCVNDANYFGNNLINRGRWSSANVTTLIDSGATKNAIRTAIQSYANKAVPGDTFIYQHSSHALNHKDTSGNFTKDVALAAYAGPYEDYELASDLAGFPSGVKVVIIIDACHSSGLFKSPQELQLFDFAERVSVLVDKLRAEKIAKGDNDYIAKIAASEIGWVTAAEYNETSADGGFYESDAWLTDWSYVGNDWAGAFMGAFTWGWWNGLADSTGVGDNDGLMDAYEGYKYAHSIVTSLGLSTPQYLNASILRNVELGTSGGSETPPVSIPSAPTVSVSTYGSNANISYINVSWTAAARATSYNVYRNTSNSTSGRTKIATNVTSPYKDYVSNGLVPGVKYWYWVEAVNTAGSTFSGSDWGNILVSASLSKTALGFTAAGGTSNITVTANTSWSATKSDSWLSLSSSGTSGNGSIAVTAEPNTTTAVRTGRIIVTAGAGTSYPKTVTNTVTQSATASVPGKPVVSASGSTDCIRLDWDPVDNAAGFAVWRATSASGTKQRVTTPIVTQNNWNTIDGVLTLVQHHYAEDTTATPGVDYWYWIAATNGTVSTYSAPATNYRRVSLSLSKSSASFGADADSDSATVTANTSWTATKTQDWLALTSASGSGDGTLSFSVTPNMDSSSRSDTITVAAGGSTAHPASTTIRVAQAPASESLPDLHPYTPSGWSGPLVLSSSKQSATTSTETSFSPNGIIYASFSVANSGTGFDDDFHWRLYVDGQLRAEGANWGSGIPSNGFSRWTSIEIGPLSVGSHEISVEYDCTDLVAESNENNNTATKTVSASGTVVCPANDNFENATAISGMTGSATGCNINATCQPGEPLPVAYSGAANTVWWSWTAPATGTANFNTFDSDLSDTVIGIYTGDSLSSLQTVATGGYSYETGHYFQSSVSFTANSGTKYSIAVSGPAYRYQGNICLGWSMSNVVRTFSVEFDANGGTGTMAPQTFSPDVAQILASCTFARSSYHFIGWSEDPDATVPTWADGALFTATEDTTLYAVWRSNKHAVEFDANGGTGTMKAQSFTWNVSKALSACTYSREHHDFAGWATSPSGEIVYSDGESIQIDEDLTLYAVWEPKTYTVSFNGNGATSGTMAAQSFTYGAAQNLRANAFQKTGHDFKGWVTTQGGAVAYADGASYSATATVTLYAVWEPKTFTVTFNGNGATSGTMAAQSFTYGVAQNLRANAFQKTGHNFKGWATTQGGAVAYADGASYSATATVTLYAVWEPKTFTVTFNGNGATSGTMAKQSFTYGVSQNLRANAFQKTGHYFKGWTTTQGGTVAYADGASYSATATVTLYAVWEPKTFTVTFNGNGATSGTMATQSFTYGVSQNLRANTFQKTGYDFKGWATTQDGTVAYADGASYSAAGNFTLYAVWAPKTYTIRFLANDGTGSVLATQRFTYGVEDPLDAPSPQRDGYSLAGWATNPRGSAEYTGGETVSFEADTDLYAVWSAGLGAALAGTERLVWTTGGDQPWFGMESDGEDVARSGAIFDEESSWIGTEVVGPGRVTFRWKVSSEMYRDYQIDYLAFFIDDEEIDWIGGEVDWESCSFDVGEGGHSFTWTYFKDEIDFDGEDCAWLDDVFFLHRSGATFAAPDATSGTVPDAIDGWENDEVILPGAGTLHRAKHDFAGWTDGTNVYTAGSTFALRASSVTLSAAWTAKVVATPVIEAGETYLGEVDEISIRCATEGATVRYTTDGSDPMGETGLVYDGSFVIRGPVTVIRAVATLDDWFDSEEAVARSVRQWAASEVLDAPDRFFDLRSDSPWTRDIVTNHDGVASMRSGVIGNDGESRISTTVYGSGTASFYWKVSSETFKNRKIDYLAFFADEEEQAWIGGEKDWERVAVRIDGDGAHKLVWVYAKDSEGNAGDDCGWLDEFVWVPDGGNYVSVETGNGETVAIERSWIVDRVSGGAADPVAAANGTAANGKPIWQAYVAGYDPNDPDADFRATIRFEDGHPVIDPDPDHRDTRTYDIDGKPTLDAEWGEPNDESRFFRVRVGAPEVSDVGGNAATLTAPNGVTTTNDMSSGRTILTWEGVQGATSYEVWRGGSGAADPAESITNTVENACIDTTGGIGVSFRYWVRAVGTNNASGLSAPVEGMRTLAKPIASVPFTYDFSGPFLSWNDIEGATSYELWRADRNDLSSAILILSNFRPGLYDGEAPPGARRYYWVRAVAGDVRGAFSDPVEAVRPLSPPAEVSATDGTRILVSWSVSTNAFDYEVFRSESSNPTSAGLVTLSNVFYDGAHFRGYDTTASPGVRSYYWVRAVNSLSTSGYSASASAVRQLAAPTGLVATDTAGNPTGVALSWTGVNKATSYEIWRGTASLSSSATKIATTTKTSYSDASAPIGTHVWYWIKAVNSLSTSGFSNSSDTIPTATPGNFTATQGTQSGKIILSWKSVSGAISYEVERVSSASNQPLQWSLAWLIADQGSGVSTFSIGSPKTSYTDTNVSSGYYQYRIRAVFRNQTGGWSGKITGWPK